MMRYFNTEGRCKPDEHYMVRLDERLDKIKHRFIDRGKYFIINRGRQYGKTTTLMALAEYLKAEYIIFPMDFQLMSSVNFADEQTFVIKFIQYMEDLFSRRREFMKGIDTDMFRSLSTLKNQKNISMDRMFDGLGRICEASEKPLIIMIDEVDSASDYQVFLDFLAMLRGYYLDRDNRPFFHSVILAGVYDIKNLKLKIRSEQEHQYNSPWNIAADFDIDMSFSAGQITAMLQEYETDHHTGMDTVAVAGEIYQYTSGYPYLVSLVCKIMDEKLPEKEPFTSGRSIWTREGITEAVKIILNSSTPLFDSMIKQLDSYKDLRKTIEAILYQGKKISYSPYVKSVSLGVMFGYLTEKNGYIAVSNRIFEMGMLNMFITEEALGSDAFLQGQRDRNQFIRNERLDMKLVLEKFVEYFNEIYSENDDKFIEKYGRKFFLLYLKPIINGTGNYYLEAQTLDAGRTDVVIDYLGEQFVVEMKIWRGNEYNERGEKQLIGYLDYFHQKKGYMLSFNFNKKKETGVKSIVLGDKIIVEAVV